MGGIRIPMVKLSLSHLPFMFSKDHFISVVIELSVRCFNTGPEDWLTTKVQTSLCMSEV